MHHCTFLVVFDFIFPPSLLRIQTTLEAEDTGPLCFGVKTRLRQALTRLREGASSAPGELKSPASAARGGTKIIERGVGGWCGVVVIGWVIGVKLFKPTPGFSSFRFILSLAAGGLGALVAATESVAPASESETRTSHVVRSIVPFHFTSPTASPPLCSQPPNLPTSQPPQPPNLAAAPAPAAKSGGWGRGPVSKTVVLETTASSGSTSKKVGCHLIWIGLITSRR